MSKFVILTNKTKTYVIIENADNNSLRISLSEFLKLESDFSYIEGANEYYDLEHPEKNFISKDKRQCRNPYNREKYINRFSIYKAHLDSLKDDQGTKKVEPAPTLNTPSTTPPKLSVKERFKTFVVDLLAPESYLHNKIEEAVLASEDDDLLALWYEILDMLSAEELDATPLALKVKDLAISLSTMENLDVTIVSKKYAVIEPEDDERTKLLKQIPGWNDLVKLHGLDEVKNGVLLLDESQVPGVN